MATGYKKKDPSGKDHPVHALAEKWRQTGRIAFNHPRSKTYSLNGGPEKNYNDTHAHLKEFFKTQ